MEEGANKTGRRGRPRVWFIGRSLTHNPSSIQRVAADVIRRPDRISW